MTSCGDKVAYLSEYLAHNAAVLHTFLHPECTDVRAYPCPASVRGGGDRHWHVGHKHKAAGERCKESVPNRPRPHPPAHTHHPSPSAKPGPKKSRSRGAA
jgi:hypothetical protein